MEKIKAILIDDEYSCTETLEIELGMYCPQVEVIAKCNSAEDGLAKIVALQPDLVFLDIEMPWMTGFELLQQLNSINFEVIFITAYDQFALKAFKFSAVDYLLKPVKKQELISAVEKVTERISREFSSQHIEAMLENINFLKNGFPNVAISTPEGIEFIPVNELLYCKADGNYCMIYKTDGSFLMLSKTLKDVESMLEGHDFERIHSGYLVNLHHIRKYIRGIGGEIVLSDGTTLPVSRTKKEGLMDRIKRV